MQDSSKAPIEGARVTLWDTATGKGLQILASRGAFSFPNVAEGDYLFKVESDGRMPVYGALHLMADGDHEINVVMLPSVQENADAVGAGAALRDTVGPPQEPAKPPKVKFPKLKKKVKPIYPEAARKAGVEGRTRIAAVMLSDGRVEDLVVLSAPDKDLAIAALIAVRQWRYSPTRLDGKPVETDLTVGL